MKKVRSKFRERFLFWGWGVLLSVSILAGLLVMEWSENKRYLENQRRSAVEQLGTIRAKLEGGLNAELLLARSIITEVVINTDITAKKYFQIARHFMEASHHIRNIGLAKGTVLTYVYPEKGNEPAIGLDYRKNTAQWPAVQRVIKGRKTVVAGPLKLLQGGIGIISRTPIYVGGPGADTHFGILSVVIDQPSLFKAAGLGTHGGPLEIAIRGKDGLGAAGDVFYGPGTLFEKGPVLMEVTLPGGSWQMAAVPAGGWAARSPIVIYYRMVAVGVWLVVLALLFAQHREISRRKEVERVRNELIETLRSTLADIKQLSGLLPICSNCKKIRDDKGYWNQLEAYIQAHSKAKFSHSICKECAAKLYPGINIS